MTAKLKTLPICVPCAFVKYKTASIINGMAQQRIMIILCILFSLKCVIIFFPPNYYCYDEIILRIFEDFMKKKTSSINRKFLFSDIFIDYYSGLLSLLFGSGV